MYFIQWIISYHIIKKDYYILKQSPTSPGAWPTKIFHVEIAVKLVKRYHSAAWLLGKCSSLTLDISSTQFTIYGKLT